VDVTVGSRNYGGGPSPLDVHAPSTGDRRVDPWLKAGPLGLGAQELLFNLSELGLIDRHARRVIDSAPNRSVSRTAFGFITKIWYRKISKGRVHILPPSFIGLFKQASS
jgi:hypothetical protein